MKNVPAIFPSHFPVSPLTGCRLLILSFACFSLWSPEASALTIINGDFESAGITRTTLTDPSQRDFVTFDLITGSGWYSSNNGDKTVLVTSGGPSGLGNYGGVQANGGAPGLGNHRGIVYVATDNFETTGQVTMSFDAFLPAATGTPGFVVKVWGVNDGIDDPEIVLWDGVIDLTGPAGNFDGLDLRDMGQASGSAPVYSGSFFTPLFTANATDLGITFGPDWIQGIQFTFDAGTGYDQIVIGFAIQDSPNAAPFSGIDNLAVVPEPAAGLLALFGLATVMVLRPRKAESRIVRQNVR